MFCIALIYVSGLTPIFLWLSFAQHFVLELHLHCHLWPLFVDFGFSAL